MDDEGHFLALADEVFLELFVVLVEVVVLREIQDALARRLELVVQIHCFEEEWQTMDDQ